MRLRQRALAQSVPFFAVKVLALGVSRIGFPYPRTRNLEHGPFMHLVVAGGSVPNACRFYVEK